MKTKTLSRRFQNFSFGRAALDLSVLLFLGLSRLFAQDADLELPGPELVKKIFNRPGIVKTEVSQEKVDENIRWIEMYTDVHLATDIPMDTLRRTILDFDNYPRIFRRNHDTAVIWKDDKVYLDMIVGLELFGISFLTAYRVLVRELRNTSEEFVLDFSHVSDDGNVKNVFGRWYLKKIPPSPGGNEHYYVRYYASSKVLCKYPFQRMIMTMFIDGESRDLMKQFLKAAEQRKGIIPP
ncbi:MAG: hypothetical protein LBR99_04830 [Treponema sp.]|nr:hypothetical protein [Treponema sp.]